MKRFNSDWEKMWSQSSYLGLDDETPLKQPKKSEPKGKNVDVALRRLIWDRYIGPGVKEIQCPLCSMYKIYQNANNGFEAAHIVAKKFNLELNVYQVYPSCSSCNSECKTMCLLDYLFARQRFNALKRIILQIYTIYLEEHGDTMTENEKLIWNVLDHLYGADRYPAGGGIENKTGIYAIAKSQQLSMLSEKISTITKSLQEVTREFAIVADNEIKFKHYPHLCALVSLALAVTILVVVAMDCMALFSWPPEVSIHCAGPQVSTDQSTAVVHVHKRPTR